MVRGRKTYFLKSLVTYGAWINWLAPIAICLYAIVCLGCLNPQLLANLYVATISPSPGTVVRVGYFGVCIQTPETDAEWTCSRFISGTKGLKSQHLSLIKAAKSLQWNALYPLPAIAAVLLFICFVAYILVRNRDERKKRYVVFGLWISCAFGFAGALIPMMVGQALKYAAPVYGSKTQMEICVLSVVVTWSAFACHLGYVLAALWWHRRIGGAGYYGGGPYEMGPA